ncbi:MAG: FHA domain-containing protein [Myxococcales bacterium]|nr:FHA domain-containing protein [Myxococcales bacterium]
MTQDPTRRRETSEAPAREPPPLVLAQVAGPGTPRTFPLPVGEHVIGREAGVQIRIEDDDVSRRHAKLVVTRGPSVSLVDLGSTNGTFVDGRRFDAGPLAPGASIEIADARLVLTDAQTAAGLRAAAGAAAPPAMASLDLTPRQLDIARLVAMGLTNQAIAERLRISPRTVTSHLDHIYTRLAISSRAALVSRLAEAGLLARPADDL